MMHEDEYGPDPSADPRVDAGLHPAERVDPDPALKCVCGFDNTPLPGDRPPESCEGCGRSL